jgi:enoyl-CoA hydratase
VSLVDVRREGPVCVLTLQREEKLNALSSAMERELLDSLAGDDVRTSRCAVLTGAGKAFSAGADINEFADADAASIAAYYADTGDVYERFAALRMPTIAAIHGWCLGGGLELALACDLRVGSENARVGQPEVLLGALPGAGGSQRLARLIGPSRAKELCWSGRQVRADEAHALGIFDRVVPSDEVEHNALHWAGQFAPGAVVAMGLAKRVIDDGLGRPLAEGLDMEADAFVEAFGTDDARVGVQSFLEHGPGKAKFTGR